MAFIKLLPKKCGPYSKIKDSIRIRFKKISVRKENYRLFINIGTNIAEKIGVSHGDRVSFSYDNQNSRTWLIQKTDDVYGSGYLVSGSANKPSASNIVLSICWDLFVPHKYEHDLHNVENDIYEGGIRIFAYVPESCSIAEPQEQENILKEEENEDD